MSQNKAVERHSGTGIVVRGNDIDTDRIIPARYMKVVTFDGLGENVFADVRFSQEGEPKDHPFNLDHHADASVLVVNSNFGCGSSREHAPQALQDWGIRAIVGESFAEIFFGNCTALGIPAVTASPDDIAALMDAIELDPAHEVTVCLETLRVHSRAGSRPIEIPGGARQQLREGRWDATATLLEARDEIEALAERIPYVSGF